mmetsp:Transcript_86535/g.249699  ORF Transcript_86535/g.249699 Transcript_86535/m.249699 type:complete len:95 (+) Transcript_86535:105-389(+)
MASLASEVAPSKLQQRRAKLAQSGLTIRCDGPAEVVFGAKEPGGTPDWRLSEEWLAVHRLPVKGLPESVRLKLGDVADAADSGSAASRPRFGGS